MTEGPHDHRATSQDMVQHFQKVAHRAHAGVMRHPYPLPGDSFTIVTHVCSGMSPAIERHAPPEKYSVPSKVNSADSRMAPDKHGPRRTENNSTHPNHSRYEPVTRAFHDLLPPFSGTSDQGSHTQNDRSINPKYHKRRSFSLDSLENLGREQQYTTAKAKQGGRQRVSFAGLPGHQDALIVFSANLPNQYPAHLSAHSSPSSPDKTPPAGPSHQHEPRMVTHDPAFVPSSAQPAFPNGTNPPRKSLSEERKSDEIRTSNRNSEPDTRLGNGGPVSVQRGSDPGSHVDLRQLAADMVRIDRLVRLVQCDERRGLALDILIAQERMKLIDEALSDSYSSDRSSSSMRDARLDSELTENSQLGNAHMRGGADAVMVDLPPISNVSPAGPFFRDPWLPWSFPLPGPGRTYRSASASPGTERQIITVPTFGSDSAELNGTASSSPERQETTPECDSEKHVSMLDIRDELHQDRQSESSASAGPSRAASEPVGRHSAQQSTPGHGHQHQ